MEFGKRARGVGILVNASQSRIANSYLDWNDLVIAEPTLVSFTGGIFLCGAHIRLLAPPSGIAHGIYIANNEFVGAYCKMGAPAVEAQGVFSAASDVTVVGTLADAMYQTRSTAATMVVASGPTPTTTFAANFTGRLLFDTRDVPIASVTYSVVLDSGVALVAHAARPPQGAVVTVEVATPVTGSVTISVDQSTRDGPGA